jgi:hypothetical protein
MLLVQFILETFVFLLFLLRIMSNSMPQADLGPESAAGNLGTGSD